MNRFQFDLLREPWIPCERLDGDGVVYAGIKETLLEARGIAAVHDSSPLVTAMLYRLLLAILQRAFAPRSQKDRAELWEAQCFDPKTLHNYLDTVDDRFDLFNPEHPFLQVPRLAEALEAKDKSIATPAWRLAPERSQHCAAAHLFARVPEGAAVSPAEAARGMLAFLGFAAGGRIQNEAASRKSGILRSGAVVLLRGRTLFQTLFWNLTWHETRKPTDVPPWERKLPQRATRGPEGPVDMLLWPSRRVLLVPERDATGAVVVRDVITAAGEDLDGEHADPQFAYFKGDDPEPVRVKMSPPRATWRDALAIFDPGTGLPGFRQPLAIAQLSELVRSGAAHPPDLQFISSKWPMSIPIGVDLLGLVGGGAGRASSIRDWHAEHMPLPYQLLASDVHLEVLRKALAEAEDLASALRSRVLFALAVNLVVGPDKATIEGIRDSLGTLPAYWSALGARFNEWLTDLGAVPVADVDAALWSWRGLLRETANAVVLQAVEDIGLTGRAIRAGAAAERVLEGVLAELVPLPEGATPEGLAAPAHEPPVWSDSTGFVPALDKLIRSKNLGALAALRTSLQAPTRISPDARPFVEPLLPEKAGRHVRRVYYLVAALAALHRDESKGVSLGQAMRRLHDPALESSATTERFDAILAAHADDVGELVSAALPLVYDRGALDWERLLHDLIFWGRRDRLVQRGWARDFYDGPPVPVSPSPTTDITEAP